MILECYIKLNPIVINIEQKIKKIILPSSQYHPPQSTLIHDTVFDI